MGTHKGGRTNFWKILTVRESSTLHCRRRNCIRDLEDKERSIQAFGERKTQKVGIGNGEAW
ncbi:hypothetical protein AKJ65_03200 [candidate division MSBL1 archaeon SCGC-AAA259E19]|uniref:Uncharacterized protein n=1 Tax=candidate division MSBL1 archaeon SCGC-AAA259E19 TaxID=1698264 RepID=A0A133UKX6_9EURY|nr:hypothetical protein AKJ65_03200 [candidate division MSBL1 archaeon SCGC-AAA259E19]